MKTVEIKNKKANFSYSIIDTYTAGIMLVGSEVKSIRQNEAQITESYCFINDQNEMYIKNMYVAEYKEANINNHETTRDRKLLLNKQEINKIKKNVSEKGTTIVPLKIFMTDKGLVKIVIGIAKGKNNSDKRNTLKDKDAKREIDREQKYE